MIRLRRRYALIIMALLAAAARAQDKPASPWAVDRALTAPPQAARRPRTDRGQRPDDGDPSGLLLPDVQVMRNSAPMLVLPARVGLAEGDFAAAAHRLETGFAFARHLSDGPTLIHKLVGIAVAAQF